MSRRFEKEEIIEAYNELVKSQSVKKAIVGALLGSLPALLLYVIFLFMGGILLWFIFIPSALVGFFAADFGKTFEFKYRLIPGFIAMVVHALGILVLFPIHVFFLVTLPLIFGVAVFFSKRKLDNLQETALWQHKHGRLQP